MLSSDEASFHRMISSKRRELHEEKRRLGLIEGAEEQANPPGPPAKPSKSVRIVSAARDDAENVAAATTDEPKASEQRAARPDQPIPRGLLRIIRRCSGLPPAMLRAGEFSPNYLPAAPAPAAAGAPDAFPGLGAYEERRRGLRSLRQREYREYCEQQLKHLKKPTQPREAPPSPRSMHTSRRTAEAATQCGGGAHSCVAVQTDAIAAVANNFLTRAERELSPRTVQEPCRVDHIENGPYIRRPSNEEAHTRRTVNESGSSPNPHINEHGNPESSREEMELRPSADIPVKPAARIAQKNGSCVFLNEQRGEKEREFGFRRRSYDQARVDQRSELAAPVQRRSRERLAGELRHTYLPSLLDADGVRQRNLRAEQEALQKKLSYQQELRQQIQEQQRIREERKAREKLLEQAEMRRLEQQLRALRAAQERESARQDRLGVVINETGVEYDRKRNLLQRDVDNERAQAFRIYKQPLAKKKPSDVTSRSDNSNLKAQPSNLPFYYQSTYERKDIEKPHTEPYSTNISDKSLFSPNYDLDTFLRESLNPSHRSSEARLTRSEYVPSFLRKDVNDLIVADVASQDSLPIPVLRHSPENGREPGEDRREDGAVSEAMKRVEDKWKVPIVQKNIMCSLPSADGRSNNILTQLGSIRRQLQLEQLKLDKMLSHEPAAK